jgi:hypothetical protein
MRWRRKRKDKPMIAPEILQAVAAAAREQDVFKLRATFPGIMFVACGEDDVPARLTPAHETEEHAFFLFTGASGHCLEFTDDIESATGIVVADKATDIA